MTVAILGAQRATAQASGYGIGLEADVDAQLAPLLAQTILGYSFGADVDPRVADRLQCAVTYQSGAAAITSPYQLKLFSGRSATDAAAAATAFMAAHPAYFFSPLTLTRTMNSGRTALPYVAAVIYNVSYADGVQNYGIAGGGGGGTPTGPATGDLSGNYPSPVVSEGHIVATGSTTVRTLSDRFANEYNVLDYGAFGDGASHPISGAQATSFNAFYSPYGTLGAVAGDEYDWCVIQGLMLKATTTGVPVYLPTGIYYTNRPLTISYIDNPIFSQPGAIPGGTKLDILHGDGLQTCISALITLSGRGILELLGSTNGASVCAHVENIRLFARVGSDLGSVCLRVGDASCGFDAYRVFCHGVNGYLLKIASSVSYAQINTRLTQCHFWGNYQGLHWADETTCTAYSIKDESGGAFWDNVLFDTCLFQGVAITRAGDVLFQNCQYVSNAVRPDSGGFSYSSNLMAYAGNLECHECYFEDHKYGILAIDGSAPIRGLLILGCHFSGTNNAPGAPPPTGAVVCANTGNWGFGLVTLIRNDINSSGYTQPSIQAQGCRVFEIGSFNLLTPGADITFDYSFCQYTRIDINGYFQSSTLQAMGTGPSALYSAGGISAVSTISSLVEVAAPVLSAPRRGTGTGNGELWGLSIDIASGLNVGFLGWSSTTYTTGGAVPWIGNDAFFLAVPFGYEFKMGFGSSSETIRFSVGGAINADGVIQSQSAVNSPFISSTRLGTGSGNGEVWGLGVSTANALDEALLGWSSTAYTTGGVLAWLGNDEPFLALPAGKTLKIGFGTGATSFVEIGLTVLYAPQASAAFGDTIIKSLGIVKDGQDFEIDYLTGINVAGNLAFNWQLSSAGHCDLYTYTGAVWLASLRILKDGGLQVLAGGIQIKTGANARIGTATLVGGTITVSNTSVTANTRVRYWCVTAGGTRGNITYTKINATSFTLNSDNPADTSIYDWELVEEIP